MPKSYKYKSAILGGTFDHFHIGHEQFIAAAFAESEHVTIGIVEKPFSGDKEYVRSIEDYSVRLSGLKSYLDKQGLLSRVDIIPIHDIYGTTLTDNSIEAIFVTDSTYPSAEKINAERQKHGLSQLKIIIVPYALSNDGKIVSSSRIRKGEIDRQGKSYLKFFLDKESYLLPPSLRDVLQHPMGTVVKNVEDIDNIVDRESKIISVGDIVSMDLAQSGHIPPLCLIDYRTRRHDLSQTTIHKHLPPAGYHLSNPAGTINKDVANILSTALSTYQTNQISQVIAVAGEEDLLALPAMLLSPLGTYVVYGQYNVGMCIVKVTEELKLQVKEYLKQF